MKFNVNKDIVTLLINSIVTFSLTFLSFTYFQSIKDKREFEFNHNYSNIEECAKKLESIERSYDSLMIYLADHNGLTKNEFEPFYNKIQKDVYDFKYFAKKVERLGSNKQIKIINSTLDYLYQGIGLLNTQYSCIEFVDTRVNGIVRNKKDAKYIDYTVKIVKNDLDELIYNENRTYFYLRDYYLPILDNLELSVYDIYRKDLGLDRSESIYKSTIEFSKLITERDSFKYNNQNPQYRLARVRRLVANGVKLPIDSMIININNADRFNLLMKFIIEQDKKK